MDVAHRGPNGDAEEPRDLGVGVVHHDLQEQARARPDAELERLSLVTAAARSAGRPEQSYVDV